MATLKLKRIRLVNKPELPEPLIIVPDFTGAPVSERPSEVEAERPAGIEIEVPTNGRWKRVNRVFTFEDLSGIIRLLKGSIVEYKSDDMIRYDPGVTSSGDQVIGFLPKMTVELEMKYEVRS